MDTKKILLALDSGKLEDIRLAKEELENYDTVRCNLIHIDEALRRTGRTTRLLNQIRLEHPHKKDGIVICKNAECLCSQFCNLTLCRKIDPHTVLFRGGLISFINLEMFVLAYLNRAIYIDHSMILGIFDV